MLWYNINRKKKFMKKYLIIIIVSLVLLVPGSVNAKIVCNDGSISKTCEDCHQGCCSHHGGCASSGSSRSRSSSGIYYISDEEKNGDLSSVIALALLGIIGAAIYGSKKEKW